ncbi:hypothetical protein [Enterococcus sp. AZ103]|uniref:hypothetical protein n=1 Tax=Enterococcus sp. AZ103 TaxID=2774628 RepID=UPI003F298F92
MNQEMTRETKINIIIDARPNMKHIILCVNDEQLDRMVEEVQKELNRELIEAMYSF